MASNSCESFSAATSGPSFLTSGKLKFFSLRFFFTVSMIPFIPLAYYHNILSGIYVVLFSSCTFILWRQKNIQKTLFLISCALFFLASTDVVVTVYFFFRFVIQNGTLTNSAHSESTSQETWNPILEAKFAIYVVAKYVDCSSSKELNLMCYFITV